MSNILDTWILSPTQTYCIKEGTVFIEIIESQCQTFCLLLFSLLGDIRSTVVGCWTAGQQVERSILRRGMIHNESHLILQLSPAQYSLNIAESWPKNTIHFISLLLTNADFPTPPLPKTTSLYSLIIENYNKNRHFQSLCLQRIPNAYIKRAFLQYALNTGLIQKHYTFNLTNDAKPVNVTIISVKHHRKQNKHTYLHLKSSVCSFG